MRLMLKKLVFILLLIFLLCPPAYTANKVYSFGFEGAIRNDVTTRDGSTTPVGSDYPFQTSYLSFWQKHIDNTHIITSWTPLGGSEWTATEGSNFFIANLNDGETVEGRCDGSPSPVAPNPSIAGITTGNTTVNNYMQFAFGGLAYPQSNGSSYITSSISTGKIYVQFKGRIYGASPVDQWGTMNGKWLQIASNGSETWTAENKINMEFTEGTGTDDIDFCIRHTNYISSTLHSCTSDIITTVDSGWKKYAMLINYTTEIVYYWIDVDTPTLLNYTDVWDASIDGGLWEVQENGATGPGKGIAWMVNFSTYEPDCTTMTMAAIDDIEVWDDLPTEDSTATVTGVSINQ